MLNERTLKSTVGPAEEFIEKGLVLSPVPDTVLNELFISSYSDITANEESIDSVLSTMQTNSEGTMDEPTIHDKVMDDTVRDLTKIVLSHVSEARNTIKPKVMEFREALTRYVEDNSIADPYAEFNIIEKSIPEFLTDATVVTEIDKYEGKPPVLPTLKVSLNDKDVDEIVKAASTGSDRLNKLLVATLADLGDDNLLAIYRSFFTSVPLDNVMTYDEISKLDLYEKLRVYTVIYMLSKKFIANVEEGTGLTLNVYLKAMADIRDHAGSNLYVVLKQVAMLIRTKQLIVRNSSARKTAIVSGEVYKEWLEDGGTPEIILGVIVGNSNDTSTVAIDKMRNHYESMWNSYVTFSRVDNANKSFRYFKEFLSRQLLSSLDETTDLEKSYLEDNPNYRDNVTSLMTEYIDGLKINDMNDLNAVSLEVVAKIRFYFTSAYSILSDIEQAFVVNKNVDVREAALLAVINYVTDYISDQISAKSWV